MSDEPEQATLQRYTGEVISVGEQFGFIECRAAANENLYFRSEWVRAGSTLAVGDTVTFEKRIWNDKPQAHQVYQEQTGGTGGSFEGPERTLYPRTSSLFDWAYLGHLPNTLTELAGRALDEQWEFKRQAPDPDHPFPILRSYLLHTFGRLTLERKRQSERERLEKPKIVVSEDKALAAFNTGLVDERYEPLYALFEPNSGRSPWKYADFCVAAEGRSGQALVRYFKPLPVAAHYFDEPADLLYDVRMSEPELSWRHVVIDRIGRYPKEFLDEHWPTGFSRQDVSQMDWSQRKAYYEALGEAVEADNRLYRRIMNRVRDAVDLSIKRVSWNFKTAVPQYYPRVKELQLLIPICLVSDEEVDMALAVEKTPSGSYLGHTVLPLDWAYRNARLICRPDSDWLAADEISQDDEDED